MRHCSKGQAKCTKSWRHSTAAKCAKLDCWTPLYDREGEQSANGIESLSVTLKITPLIFPLNVESIQMWCLGLVVGPEKLCVSVWPPQRENPCKAYHFLYRCGLLQHLEHMQYFSSACSPKNEVSKKIQDLRQCHHWYLRHYSREQAKCTKSWSNSTAAKCTKLDW